ncbi:unnamed protein product [Mytilus edulis]|uniref:Uncharacterized protein n=1 Tax=Mytilus edulis TaxID=6550 RepID=A0A8S3Q3H1_MYTED|nr:unnamed protein product [Mytilus edulis]
MPTEVQHGFTGECFPDHFNLNARPKIKEQKPGQLSDEEIEQFFTKGYVVIEKFFTKDELEPCKDAVNDQLECLAQKLYKTKRIKNLYRELGFYERLTAIEAEWPGANILMHKGDGLPQVSYVQLCKFITFIKTCNLVDKTKQSLYIGKHPG